ncbi:MAG: pyridoxamine 5'-phosphate oxidase family protein [Marinibacterium sp.]|nr:pyridoxamine 5'-phosphate oxidase family protein [Marinibacterium sp.]
MAQVYGHYVDEVIGTQEALRAIVSPAGARAANKVIDNIDDAAARFIAASSLVFVASRSKAGILDLTPRGDPAGFVHVLDPKTLALPDRPGNHRMDTFTNVIDTGDIGLIFVIPGHRDTLRVAGRATLVRDAALGEQLAVHGKPSEFVLMIQVNHVQSHCPKAFVRGGVWDSAKWPDTSNVPSLAELMVAHGSPVTVQEMDDIMVRDGETRLY